MATADVKYANEKSLVPSGAHCHYVLVLVLSQLLRLRPDFPFIFLDGTRELEDPLGCLSLVNFGVAIEKAKCHANPGSGSARYGQDFNIELYIR